MIRLHRAGLVLTGIAVALLSLAGALPANASSMVPLPPWGAPGTPPAQPAATVVRTIVVGGMPGWQIALIAIAAALVAATAVVLAYRVRTTRSRVPQAGARQAQTAATR